jgi:hypothetical protein
MKSQPVASTVKTAKGWKYSWREDWKVCYGRVSVNELLPISVLTMSDVPDVTTRSVSTAVPVMVSPFSVA